MARQCGTLSPQWTGHHALVNVSYRPIWQQQSSSWLMRSRRLLISDVKRGWKRPGRHFMSATLPSALLRTWKSEGGYLSRDDLANFRSEIGPAVQGRWRDFELFTCGPWCQGPTLIQSLLMMEKAGLDGLSQNSADYLHLLIEVIKCVFADREYYYGDPDFVDVPLERLHRMPISMNGSNELIRNRPCRICRHLSVLTMPFQYPATEGLPVRDPDTSYLCVVDKWGNAFSATPSDGMLALPRCSRARYYSVATRHPVTYRPEPSQRRRSGPTAPPHPQPGNCPAG